MFPEWKCTIPSWRRLAIPIGGRVRALASDDHVNPPGPLGLCGFPDFVCLGVLPVVVGLAEGMLPGVLP